MKKITQKEFESLPVVGGLRQCPGYTNYSLINKFEGCSFSEGCSFGKACSFGEGCSFKTWSASLLRAKLGTLSDKLTYELMKRDQESHPFPEMFDKWAEGGECPYSLPIERLHFFKEERSCWNRGFQRMSTPELLRAVCKEKQWKMPYTS